MADQIDMRALAAEKTKGEMEYRSLTFDRAAVNVDDRRVDMAMSSEQPVERWFGNEILDHRAEAIDVSFMGSGMAPLLLDHKSDQQIGVVEDVSLGADKKFRGTVRFSKNVTASEVFDDVADGIRSNVSIGYRISENGAGIEGRKERATRIVPSNGNRLRSALSQFPPTGQSALDGQRQKQPNPNRNRRMRQCLMPKT